MRLKIISRLFSLMIAILLVASIFAPIYTQAAAPLENSYIIVFNDTVEINEVVPAVAKAHGLQIGYIYQHALKGMSAVVSTGRLTALENDPRVAYVVEDMIRTIDGQNTPTGISRIFANTNTLIGIDGTDDYRVDVDVAIIDTGIDLEHPDLNVDVVNSVSCFIFDPIFIINPNRNVITNYRRFK